MPTCPTKKAFRRAERTLFGELSCSLWLCTLPWCVPRRYRHCLLIQLPEPAPYLRQLPICGLRISRLSDRGELIVAMQETSRRSTCST